MGELKSSGKSFEISKWEVHEAWEKVRANKGAAGVDGCCIEDFEKDLKNNLQRSGTECPLGVTFRRRCWPWSRGPRQVAA